MEGGGEGGWAVSLNTASILSLKKSYYDIMVLAGRVGVPRFSGGVLFMAGKHESGELLR